MCVCKKGCCCCLSLRAGCIINTVIEIILSCIGVGYYWVPIGSTLQWNYFNWASIIGLFLNILAGGCLLFAAVAVNSSINLRGIGILVCVGFNLLYTILIFVSAIFFCIGLASGWDAWYPTWILQHALLAALIIFYVLLIFCYIYFIVVAISYYRELKEGDSNNGDNV